MDQGPDGPGGRTGFHRHIVGPGQGKSTSSDPKPPTTTSNPPQATPDFSAAQKEGINDKAGKSLDDPQADCYRSDDVFKLTTLPLVVEPVSVTRAPRSFLLEP